MFLDLPNFLHPKKLPLKRTTFGGVYVGESMGSNPPTIFILTSAIAAGLAASLSAATTALTISRTQNGIFLETPADDRSYFILNQSESLVTFQPISLELGTGGVLWEVVDPTAARQFFQVRQVSIFAPEDTDGDTIDDLYELSHPDLDPLNGADADLTIPGQQITYLQQYRNIFGFSDDTPQFYSREVTAFNFGAPVDAAISREFTLFNFGEASAPVEAISQEISIYNGSGPLPYAEMPQVYSREVTTFNFGSPSAAVEAISREVSLYNGSGPLPYADMPQVYSREVTTFNFGSPSAPIEAISREVSVFAIASEQ